MTYTLCKKKIEKGFITDEAKAEMKQMLDVFLLSKSISTDQYTELVGMMETPA